MHLPFFYYYYYFQNYSFNFTFLSVEKILYELSQDLIKNSFPRPRVNLRELSISIVWEWSNNKLIECFRKQISLSRCCKVMKVHKDRGALTTSFVPLINHTISEKLQMFTPIVFTRKMKAKECCHNQLSAIVTQHWALYTQSRHMIHCLN